MNEEPRYCHERGEEHDFDTVPGRMNAARHCTKCPMISLDWDDVEEPIEFTSAEAERLYNDPNRGAK